MKNFFTLLIFCCLLSNCSNDSDETTFATPSTTASLASKPEANPIFDESYKGIYKGIVVGNTSGAIYVDILNDEKIWAKLETDNHETYVLENVPMTEEEASDALPFFITYRFANEDVSFDVKLDDTGDNIIVSNFKFFSNSASKVCLVKEKSTSLIKCYTGVFSGQKDSGKINFTSDGQLKVKGLSMESNTMNFINVSGQIHVVFPNTDTSKLGNNGSPVRQSQINANLHIGEITGILEGYEFDGNWVLDNYEIGNWNATRIL